MQNWFHNNSPEPVQFKTIVAPPEIFGKFGKTKETQKGNEKYLFCLKNDFCSFQVRTV